MSSRLGKQQRKQTKLERAENIRGVGRGSGGKGVQTTNPTAIYTHNLQINFTPNCGQPICHALSPKRAPSAAGRRYDWGGVVGEVGRVGVGNNLRLSSLDLSRSRLGTPQARATMQIWCNSAAEGAGEADGASQASEAKEPRRIRAVEKPKSILVAYTLPPGNVFGLGRGKCKIYFRQLRILELFTPCRRSQKG